MGDRDAHRHAEFDMLAMSSVVLNVIINITFIDLII